MSAGSHVARADVKRGEPSSRAHAATNAVGRSETLLLGDAGHTLTLDQRQRCLWSGPDDCSKRLIEVA